jgi:hypothetical protein
MKKAVLLFVVSLFVSSVHASDFRDIKISEIKSSKIELPAPVMAAAGVSLDGCATGEITKLHLLASTNQSQLVSDAATPELFKEFTDYWTPILKKSGMEITGSDYSDTVGVLKYKSADGRVIREFMADKLHYDALDPAAIAKLQQELLAQLGKAGMTPVAAFTIKNDALRPTFAIYYLTKPDDNTAHETRLRQLIRADGIDYDVMETGGVNMAEKDTDSSMVYIGKEILVAGKMADTEANVNKKVADYLGVLETNKKELIGYRVHKLDEPYTVGGLTYNYQANIYSYN